MDSVEYKTLTQCFPFVVVVLEQAPSDVADQPELAEVLAPRVVKYLRNPNHEDDVKARKLLDTVKDQTKLDPGVYQIFIKALKANGPWTKKAVERLESTYAALSGSTVSFSSADSEKKQVSILEQIPTPLSTSATVSGAHMDQRQVQKTQGASMQSTLPSNIPENPSTQDLGQPLTGGQYEVTGPSAADPGFLKMIGQISVTITNDPRDFRWDTYGFSLTVPSNSLPPNVKKCVLHISAYLSPPFKIPQGHTLVSGVYSIKCEPQVKFKQNLQINFEHFASPKIEDQSCLAFLQASDQMVSQSGSSVLLEGDFSAKTCYGSLQVKQFSWYAIVLKKVSQVLYGNMRYSAMLFYNIRSVNEVDVEVAVCHDLQAHVKAIKDCYLNDQNFVSGPECSLKLLGTELSLQIEDTSTLPSGQQQWTFEYMATPTLTRERIDHWSGEFRSANPSGVFPAFKLKAVFDDTAPACDLSRRLTLNGALEENMWLQVFISQNSLTGTRMFHPPTNPSNAYNTMIRCCEGLISAMAQEPKTFVLVLFRKGLVSQNILEQTLELVNETSTEKGTRLYLAVLHKVKAQPTQFADLVDCFSCSGIQYDSILTELQSM